MDNRKDISGVGNTTPMGPIRVWSYGLGAFGNNIHLNLITVFLLVFMTDIAGVDAKISGTLIALALGIGAIANLVAGPVTGATVTRFGTYRPWVAGGGIALAALITLVFTSPELLGLPFQKHHYFGVVVTAFAFIYTFTNVPYMSLNAAMTPDVNTRTRLAGAQAVLAALGTLTVYIGFPYAVAHAGGGMIAYASSTFLFGMIAVLAHVVCSAMAIEKTTSMQSGDRPLGGWRAAWSGYRESVFANPALILIMVAFIPLMVGLTVRASSFVYFFKYVAKDDSLFPIFGGLQIVSMLAGSAVAPAVSRHFGRVRTLSFCALFAALSSLALFGLILMLDLQSSGLAIIWGLAVLFSVSTVFFGPVVVLGYSSLADAAGLAGEGRESYVYGFSYLAFKVAQGLGAGIVGWSLAAVGFKANAPADGLVELTITSLGVGLPAVCLLLAALPFRLNSIRQRVH